MCMIIGLLCKKCHLSLTQLLGLYLESLEHKQRLNQMFVCSVNQWLFNHILNTMCGSGVLNKDDVGLEKVQEVTMIKGKEWLVDGSDGLDPYFLV